MPLIDISIKRSAFFLGLWLLLSGVNPVFSQIQRDVSFRFITPNDGLSQSTVRDILQDHIGYMWFATQDGLNLYNGYEIKVYKHDRYNQGSISNNDISNIFEDSRNNIWVGTLGGGLNLYNRETDDFISYTTTHENPAKRIAGDVVFWTTEDSEGWLWVGTDQGISVQRQPEEAFLTYQHTANDTTTLSSNIVNHIYEDSRGNIWVSTVEGLNRFNRDKESFTRYLNQPGDPESLGSNLVYSTYEDSRGTFWIGTQTGGLHAFDYETEKFRRYVHDPENSESLANNSVYSIFEDSHGTFWIGTENGGLDIFDRDQNVFYHNRHSNIDPTSLRNDAIYCIYESRDHILWLGTYSGGVHILKKDNSKFQHFVNDPYDLNTIGYNSVLSFLEDSKGNFWVGTDGGERGGLNLFDAESGKLRLFKHDPFDVNTPPDDVIFDLFEDNEGYIWIATYEGGISRFNYKDSSFTHYQQNAGSSEGLRSNSVFSLYQDSENRIWAGTNVGGINVLEPGESTFRGIRKSKDSTVFNSDYVRDFLEDSQGNFWVATYGYGLVKLNRETEELKFYALQNSNISNHIVLVLYEDQKGRIWIGTKGTGIDLFDPITESFINYSEADGLPNGVVNGILEDNSGNLWISTNNGLSKFNPEEETFKNFSVEDGLQSREFNQNSSYKDKDGFMYFGGINGYNKFHPDSIRPGTEVHPVVLTDFEVFNKPVEIGPDSPLKKHISQADEIILSHDKDVLSISYSAINFNEIKGDQYAYMLQGFDENWNNVGEQREATYTNLDPGEYTFRVRVANSDGFWNPKEATLRLVITPPFWRTTLFYILMTLLVFGSVAFIFNQRVKSITVQNKRLEKEVAERTVQIREKNADLEEALEDLRKTRGELVENAHKAGMADIATGVLHNVGNILNSVNTSAALIEENLKNSRLAKFAEANNLLRQHADNLDEFILNDPRGKKLLEYYLKLEEAFRLENEEAITQSRRLKEKILLINDVIAAQQSYATAERKNDVIHLSKLIDDTLTLFANSLEKHGIELEKDFGEVPPVSGQRTKLIHVIINLLKNSKEAILNSNGERKIVIKIRQEKEEVLLNFSDTGSGIKPEHLPNIFKQGFTTKEEGHGFGLHSCANYLKEMRASIKVFSEGQGKGARFEIRFNKARGHNQD